MCWNSLHDISGWWLLIAIITAIACWAGNVFLRSDLCGTIPNDDGSHNPSCAVGRCSRLKKPPEFMLRYAPNELDKGEDTKAA